jgi:hypothetical protein
VTLLSRKRRQRTMVAFGAGLAGLLLIPTLGFLAADALRTSKEGTNVLSGLPPLQPIPTTPGSMLAVTDRNGAISSIVVLALKPVGDDGVARGGTIIVVPAGTRTTSLDGAPSRLADSYTTGGVDGLKAAVEGAISVALERADVVTEQQLAVLLAPLGEVQANLPGPLIEDTAEVLPAGPSTLGASALAAALATPIGPREIERLPIVGELWSAVAQRIGTGIQAAPLASPTTSIEGFLSVLYSGSTGSFRLVAAPVTDPVENPAGLDLLKLDSAVATLAVATVLPSVVSPPYASVTFYVRSPLTDPRLTLEAVSRLLFKGANVVLVKEDDSVTIPPRNTIEYLDETTALEAGRFAEALGPYDVVPIKQRIDGVDVILTLGSEFLVDADLDRTNAPTTLPGSQSPFATDPPIPTTEEEG